jgi:Skp family chaperone for outer membrane proteins
MRFLQSIFAVFILTFAVAGSVAAQSNKETASPVLQNNSSTKEKVSSICFVETSLFYDEKEGIAVLAKAIKSLQREILFPSTDGFVLLQERIKKAKEAEASRPKPPEGAIIHYESDRLMREYQYKEKEFKALYQKRFDEVVTPIINDIRKELEAFVKQRGFKMLIDISGSLPICLFFDESLDITKAFIAYYNSKHPLMGTMQPATPAKCP